MIPWIKAHKYYLIGTGVILLALLAAFFFGGTDTGTSGGQGNASSDFLQEQIAASTGTSEAADTETDISGTSDTASTADTERSTDTASEAGTKIPPDTGAVTTQTSEATETTTAAERTTEEPVTTETPQVTYSCTLQISCASILNYMDILKPEKAGLIPADGIILSARTITFTAGESAYDVLRRACMDAGVPLDAVYTPAYGTAYIKGINNIYEFDCGSLSGWKYCVNGVCPNYGCSAYEMQDGDTVLWNYSCDMNEF